MPSYLASGFDLGRIGGLEMGVADGTNSGTATLSTGRFCHRSLAALISGYGAFSVALDAAIDAVLTTHGASVSFSEATGRYTVGPFNANATLTMTSTAGQRMAAALGFTAAHASGTGSGYSVSLSGATSYVGNVAPRYYVALSRDGISRFTRPYDAPGQTRHVITTRANGYGISPHTKIRFVDFEVRLQHGALVFPELAESAAPWTLSDLFDHAGTWEPIALVTTGAAFVYKDRGGDLTNERRTPQWSDYHGRWTVLVEGQFLGWLSP